MADQSDVEAAIVSLLATTLYPDGTARSDLLGATCSVYRGWPSAADLDSDLNAGRVNVSVYPRPNTDRTTTRFVPEWRITARPVATITAAADVTGTQITFGGTVQPPQNVSAIVNGRGYVYAVQAGDTLATIATALALRISADTPASSAGPVLTVPGAFAFVVRVGGVGTAIRELRRQTKGFQVTAWCPTPALRDRVASILDVAMAQSDSLVMPDGSTAWVRYLGSTSEDGAQKALCYRRDLIYLIEYATTETDAPVEVTVVNTAITVTDRSPAPITRSH